MLEVLDDIEESAKDYETFEEWELMLKSVAAEVKKQGKNREQEGVVLATMHGTKGLEFTNVFISGVIEGVIPHHKSQLASEIEEERRLLYVAMTRAKEQLIMYAPEMYHNKRATLSPFMGEIYTTLHHKKLTVGGLIRHKTLGVGRIMEVLEKDILVVKFKENETRKIDSHYTLKNDIIRLEDDSNEKTK